MQVSSTADQTKNDFVFNLLSDKSNWTEDVISKLMEEAFVAPKQDEETCRKMACKFLYILRKSARLNPPGKNWIPTQSCVDLTTTGAALSDDEKQMSLNEVRKLWASGDAKARQASKRTPRQFKQCLGCGRRFLAKRANNLTCSRRCRNRAYRNSEMSPISATAPLEGA